MLANLNALLPEAAKGDYAVPCFNVFGHEDAVAVLEGAEALGRPVILGCNKDLVEFMGLELAAATFTRMAESSVVPVCVHLDHTYEEDIVYRAIRAGFSSVMFDGSQLPLEENIERSARVAQVAHACDVSVEGEIGSVPYEEGRDHIKSIFTDPEVAAVFARESGVDCVAISVGNVHRRPVAEGNVDFELVDRISRLVPLPLVIHGTSGIPDQQIKRLKSGPIAKFNIGTCLRQAFGNNLRRLMNEEPETFDRIHFMRKVIPFVREEAMRNIRLLS